MRNLRSSKYNNKTDKSYGIFTSPFVNENDKPFLEVEVATRCSKASSKKKVIATVEYTWGNMAPALSKALKIAREAINS